MGDFMSSPFTRGALALGGPGPTKRLWVNAAGTLGVILASSAFLLERDIMRLGELLMFLALLAALPTAWRFLRTNPAFWIFLIWVATLITSNSLAIANHDIPTDHNIWNAARHWSRVGWIPLMAWLIAGRLGIVRTIFFGYTVCWFALTLPEVSIDTLQAGLQGARLDFGTGNPHRAALPFMITTLILGFLARDWVGPRQQWAPFLIARFGLWGLALAYSVFGMLSAQGAGPIGGAFTGSLIGFFVLWRHLTEGQKASAKIRDLALGTSLLALLFVALGTAFKPAIDNRLVTFSEGIAELSDGTIERESGTVGGRYYLWTFAAQKWADRPLIGYGTEAARSMIPLSNLPEGTRKFTHLHNSFLELIFSTGVLGGIILLALFAHISYKVAQSNRNQSMPKRFSAFFFTLTIAFALANAGESYITFNDFWPHLALISAGFYSLALFGEPKRHKNAYNAPYSARNAAGESG